MSEKRAPSHSAPRRRRRNGPRDKAGFAGRRIAVAISSSPTKVPTAETLENQGGLCPTMIFSGERRQPRLYVAFGDMDGVAALWSGCAAEPKASRRRGAECVAFQGFSSVVNHRSPLQSITRKPYKADVGAIVGSFATGLPTEPYRTCSTSVAIGRVPISSEGRGSA